MSPVSLPASSQHCFSLAPAVREGTALAGPLLPAAVQRSGGSGERTHHTAAERRGGEGRKATAQTAHIRHACAADDFKVSAFTHICT